MANKTTSQETEITDGNIDGTELVRVAKSGSNFMTLISSIKTWLAAQIGRFSALSDAYDLAEAAPGSVPVLNSAGTALIPMVLADSPVEVEVLISSALAGTWTYDNGASGVGATLTKTINGALPTIDGVTAIVGRTYLHNQWTGANRIRNGCYELTQVGSAGTPAIFTRLTSSDSSSELNSQAVIITRGSTTNRGKLFTQTTSAPIVGTSNIIYQEKTVTAPSTVPTSITVAAAQTLVTNGTVVVGRWYSVTDSSQVANAADRIWVRGATPDSFDTNALYLDSVNGYTNDIIYVLDDTPTDYIYVRRDAAGNEIADFGAYGTLPTFPFNDTATYARNRGRTGLVVFSFANTFIDNEFNELSVSDGGFASVVFAHNVCTGNSVTLIAGGDNARIVDNIIRDSSTVTASNEVQDCIIMEGCSIDDNGFTINGCIFMPGTTYTAAGNISNLIIFPNGTAISNVGVTTESGVSYIVTAGRNVGLTSGTDFGVTITSQGTGKVNVANGGALNIANVPNYADNAAATGAGLVAGDLYRTSTGGTSTLKIVE